jgi:hypothetical protein
LAWVVFVTITALPMAMAGWVWGGPWPPRRAVEDDGEQDELRGMRRATAMWAGGVIVTVWRVDLIESVWLRYALVALLPLVVGVTLRRTLDPSGNGDEEDPGREP